MAKPEYQKPKFVLPAKPAGAEPTASGPYGKSSDLMQNIQKQSKSGGYGQASENLMQNIQKRPPLQLPSTVPSNFAAGLAADQGRDAFTARQHEGVSRDGGGSEEGRKSPLELPQRSYTQVTGDKGEGIPSTVMGMQEQRQREERMQATAEQFAGVPTTPTVGAKAPAEGQEDAGTKRRGGTEVKQEKETPSAGDYYAGQQKEAKKREAAKEQQRSLAEQRQQQYIKAKRKIAKEKWDAASAALALTSISGIGFVAFVMMKNVQLINQFTVKDTRIPEPSIPQIGLISCVDLVMCCTILPVLLSGCLAMLVAVMIVTSVIEMIAKVVGK